MRFEGLHLSGQCLFQLSARDLARLRCPIQVQRFQEVVSERSVTLLSQGPGRIRKPVALGRIGPRFGAEQREHLTVCRTDRWGGRQLIGRHFESGIHAVAGCAPLIPARIDEKVHTRETA